MKGFLITGGEQPEFNLVKSFFTENPRQDIYVCAADSGLDYCLKNSIRPDYILGDMDSLSDRSVLNGFSKSIIEEHPAEKDFTDTELGLDHLKDKGTTEITVIGGGGGRLDHILAIVSLFDRPDPPDLWITAGEKITHIKDSYNGKGKISETVSLFPVGPDVCTMESTGLRWPLNTLSWKKGDLGISNRLITEDFSIKMKSGRLMLIRILEQGLHSL